MRQPTRQLKNWIYLGHAGPTAYQAEHGDGQRRFWERDPQLIQLSVVVPTVCLMSKGPTSFPPQNVGPTTYPGHGVKENRSRIRRLARAIRHCPCQPPIPFLLLLLRRLSAATPATDVELRYILPPLASVWCGADDAVPWLPPYGAPEAAGLNHR
jgi:hypothetical protein